MLPYGLFPERQRNENLKLPVLNIREELSAVFAADSLHVAHSVATDSGSAPCERASECRTLSLWAGLNEVINKYLDQYTLADLLREDDGFDYVI